MHITSFLMRRIIRTMPVRTCDRRRHAHYYAPSHEWVDDQTGRVGITDHAQRKLGDVIFVSLPSIGDSFQAGEEFATIDSVKATSDILAPVDGTVVAINEVRSTRTCVCVCAFISDLSCM
jgi:glycine cleavage system H lipoate-binding protein